MDNRFGRFLCRDIHNIFRSNRRFFPIIVGLFILSSALADMQLAGQDADLGIGDYFINTFYGCTPFSQVRSGTFQLPLAWFVLLYFCVYTAILYPIQDLKSGGMQVLLRAKSRQQWWASKCCAISFWVVSYFFMCLFVFSLITMVREDHLFLSCTINLPVEKWGCFLAFLILFSIWVSLCCFCLSLFLSFALGNISLIAYLVSIAFFEPPISIGSYSMLVRCRSVTGEGLDEAKGIFSVLILMLVVYCFGKWRFKNSDIFISDKG